VSHSKNLVSIHTQKEGNTLNYQLHITIKEELSLAN